jgi:microcystin-dependent protein
VTTFALPDLQGRAPLHFGAGRGLSPRKLGQSGGEEQVALTAAQMPAHSHAAICHEAAGNSNSPVNRFWSKDAGSQSGTYHDAGGATMNPGALANAGGGQPHDNMPPFLTLNFVIALQGIYPPRS